MIFKDRNEANNNLTINGGTYDTVTINSNKFNGEGGNDCSNNNIIINGGTVREACAGLASSINTNNIYETENTWSNGIGNTITINDGTVGYASANTINVYGGSIKDSNVVSDSAGYTGHIVSTPDSRTAGEINIYNAPDLSEAIIAASNVATSYYHNHDGSNSVTTISGATLNTQLSQHKF